jgi:hypothetical protein
MKRQRLFFVRLILPFSPKGTCKYLVSGKYFSASLSVITSFECNGCICDPKKWLENTLECFVLVECGGVEIEKSVE